MQWIRKKQKTNNKKDAGESYDRYVNRRGFVRCRSIGEGVLLLIAAIIVAIVSGNLIGWFLDGIVGRGIPDSLINSVDIYIESTVAAISAGFVVLQLKSGEKQDKHHTDVEEAEFVLEYNKSFIENDKLTEVERYLECRMSGENYDKIQRLEDRRQDMVNYLVYLEGLASCIHSEILTFERIDNLFAYRFFIAMNHIDPQVIGLLPFATYYRGCFQLYEKWLAYRISCKKYSTEDDWGLPLFSTALCNHYGYEKYACPEMEFKAKKEDDILSLEACFSKKEYIILRLDTRSMKCVEIDFGEKIYEDSPEYRSLMRRILKEMVYAEISENETVQKWAAQFEYISVDDDNAKKCLNAIKYTKAIKIAREQSRQGNLRFYQLKADDNLSVENLEKISALIYNTDETKHIFKKQPESIECLKNLFKNSDDKLCRREHLFVYCAGGCVMGIILWCEDVLNKSESVFNNEHDRTTACQVSNDSRIAILCLCLDAQVRRMGIASIMLQEFLDQHKDICVEVKVLSTNIRAINLYANNGFQRIPEDKACCENGQPKILVLRRER